MRTLLLSGVVLCATLLANSSSRAAVPGTMNIQGRLTNASGIPLPPGFKSLTFAIYNAEASGTEIWSGETLFIPTDTEGLWNASIGTVTPLTAAVFADSVRWLEIIVDDGVNPPETLPRVRLNTGPYAFHAESAVRADTADMALSSLPDNDWIITDSILATANLYGLMKGNAGNLHYGDSAHTIVNFGVACTTGLVGFDAHSVTIGGGRGNANNGDQSTIGGGVRNSITNFWCTIAGGTDNRATGAISTIGGGILNLTTSNSATVSGGSANIADGQKSTVGGGERNYARGDHSTIGGGGGTGADSNSALGQGSTIGGGRRHGAMGAFTTVSGGDYNFAVGDTSTISGGTGNVAYGASATVSGGRYNNASQTYATIGGGYDNSAGGSGATVAGGQSNITQEDNATVGGGVGNQALAVRSTIAGGHYNSIYSAADYSSICGGQSGIISGTHSIIGGGKFNRNRGDYSVVCGGGGSAEADSNSASGDYASIGGGRRNYVSGNYGAVPGGYNNIASGSYTFAGGYRAVSQHLGAFVWSDGSSANSFSSSHMGNNSFSARAYGGVFFATGTGIILPYVGATLQSGATAWSAVCDSATKTNIRPVNGAEVLSKIAELPINRWNYKHQADNPIDHIGPMAQDFYRLFQVGHDDKTISTLDPDGIALAAIKELHARNAELEQRVEQLTTLVEHLANRQ